MGYDSKRGGFANVLDWICDFCDSLMMNWFSSCLQ